MSLLLSASERVKDLLEESPKDLKEFQLGQIVTIVRHYTALPLAARLCRFPPKGRKN